MFQDQNRETTNSTWKVAVLRDYYDDRAWQDRVSQHNTKPTRPRQIFWYQISLKAKQDQDLNARTPRPSPRPIFRSQTGLVLRAAVSDQITEWMVLEKLLCPSRYYDDERDKTVFHNTTPNLQVQDQDHNVQHQDRFFGLRPVLS